MGAVRRECPRHHIRPLVEGVWPADWLRVELTRWTGCSRRLRHHVPGSRWSRSGRRWTARSQSLGEHYVCQRHQLVSFAHNYEPRSFPHYCSSPCKRECIILFLGATLSIPHLHSALELYAGEAN